MEMSDYVHLPATLPSEKVFTESACEGEEDNRCPCRESNIDWPESSQSLYLLSYSN
jgi:hypothetical protein